jgi:hypothetical protein
MSEIAGARRSMLPEPLDVHIIPRLGAVQLGS